jgi:iron complex outermembrane receptor protein
MKIYLLLYLGLLCKGLQAQETSFQIKVVSQQKELIPFATISVTDHNDHTRKQSAITDSSGTVTFRLDENGQYIVTITAVNYQPLERRISLKSGQRLFEFIINPAEKTLEEVVVTAKKPLMRQEDDKVIVDPENLVAASTNGFEVIEKTPGLFVDQDGNIYISSLSPATVQINGRDMRMSTADVATMLRNLPPNAIQKIEIVRTPSSKYDASSNGGVVNVVLRKGVRIGKSGSVNGGWQQGRYGSGSLSQSLNDNTDRRSTSFTISYNRRNSFDEINTARQLSIDTSIDQRAYTIYPADALYASYTVSLSRWKKWELSYDAQMNYNVFRNRSTITNVIQKHSQPLLLSDSENKVGNEGYTLSGNTGISSKYKIDTMGSEWTTDVNFTYSENSTDQVYRNQFALPAVFTLAGDGNALGRRNLLVGRSDLKLKLKNKITFEAGLQATFNYFTNNSLYFFELNGARSKDDRRSNYFRYRENINSAYLQGAKTFSNQIVLKAGARLENTNMQGRQLQPGDTSFNIHRTDLFPYIFLSRSLFQIKGYDLRGYLVYRRSIRRPSYDQLNPFVRYIDQYLSEIGNPALRPQFTTNYEANVSVDERPILAVGFNDTRDIFSNVIYQADSNRSQAYRTFDNVGSNKEWYFRALAALPPGGKYFIVIGTQFNYNRYEGLYENQPLFFSRGTWSLFTYQTLRLDKRSVLTVNGFVRFRGQQQFYELSRFGALNVSLNRKFLKDKLIVTLSGNDIFWTNRNQFTLVQGSVRAEGTRLADTRRVGINIRYNFGIRKKDENNFFKNLPDEN